MSQCTKINKKGSTYNTSSMIGSQQLSKPQYKRHHHAHTFSGMGPKNGIAAPIHARQSATSTPNPGMTAHDVNPHSVAPRPKSTMKLFIDVMRALTTRMIHSVVRVSLSRFLGTLWGSVVLRACDGEGRWRESSPTTSARDNSCCLLSILLGRLLFLSVCRLHRDTSKLQSKLFWYSVSTCNSFQLLAATLSDFAKCQSILYWGVVLQKYTPM